MSKARFPSPLSLWCCERRTPRSNQSQVIWLCCGHGRGGESNSPPIWVSRVTHTHTRIHGPPQHGCTIWGNFNEISLFIASLSLGVSYCMVAMTASVLYQLNGGRWKTQGLKAQCHVKVYIRLIWLKHKGTQVTYVIISPIMYHRLVWQHYNIYYHWYAPIKTCPLTFCAIHNLRWLQKRKTYWYWY